jgi:hypothetical protein
VDDTEMHKVFWCWDSPFILKKSFLI